MGKHISVPSLSEFEEDRPRLIVHDGVPYCLMKHEGKVRGFVAVCTHKDRAIVPLRLKKGAIPCPHHGATFDPLTGEVEDERGNDVPEGMPPVEILQSDDGVIQLHVRKRHKKMLSKKERRRVAKLALRDARSEPSSPEGGDGRDERARSAHGGERGAPASPPTPSNGAARLARQ